MLLRCVAMRCLGEHWSLVEVAFLLFVVSPRRCCSCFYCFPVGSPLLSRIKFKLTGVAEWIQTSKTSFNNSFKVSTPPEGMFPCSRTTASCLGWSRSNEVSSVKPHPVPSPNPVLKCGRRLLGERREWYSGPTTLMLSGCRARRGPSGESCRQVTRTRETCA